MGSQYKGSAARIDLMKQQAGIDVQAMYPAADQLGAERRDLDLGDLPEGSRGRATRPASPFALPAGTFPDATDWIGAMFRCYGADLVDAKGDITIRNNDKLRQVLDYAQRLFQHIPAEMFAADDATNNRALIAGRAALIFNPPSAWAVAKRDAPRSPSRSGTSPSPKGPRGITCRTTRFFWGIWQLRPEQARGQGAARAPDAARAGGDHGCRHPMATTSRPSRA